VGGGGGGGGVGGEEMKRGRGELYDGKLPMGLLYKSRIVVGGHRSRLL